MKSKVCWFGLKHSIFSSPLDLVVLWFQDLFVKRDAAGRRCGSVFRWLPLRDTNRQRGRVAHWMYRHYASGSAIVLFIGDFRETVS